MLDADPQWHFNAAHALKQWYGHVQLLDHHVLGQWFCLDRETGKPLWERRFHRPNTVCGVAQDVIIASEMRSDGPWTGDFGCYGISLLTGELLWTSHRSGVWGPLLRLLDFIPDFTNDVRDSPAHVTEDECICESGRVLDVQTGNLVRRIPRKQVAAFERAPASPQRSLGETGYRIDAPRKIKIGHDAWLSHRLEGEPIRHMAGELRLHRFRDDGSLVWSFDVAQTRYHPQSSHYCPGNDEGLGFVYITASEEPTARPDPREGAPFAVPNPTRHHLLTLDLHSGSIVQEIPVSNAPLTQCRIEDADDAAVLISINGSHLRYHRRSMV